MPTADRRGHPALADIPSPADTTYVRADLLPICQTVGVKRRSAATRRWILLLWLIVIAATTALVVIRYKGAVADRPYDFYAYFYPAGRLILEGQSPFDAPGYVYSPLVALLAAAVAGMTDPVVGWTLLSLTAGVAAVALFIWSVWNELTNWQRPIVAMIAVGTLYFNWQTTLMMGLGQVETYVLLAMTAVGLSIARSKPGAVGAGLAAAALVKTWPVVSGVWLLRRTADRRLRTLLAALVTTIIAVAATGFAFGSGALTQWFRNVLSARTQSQLVHFNAWDVGRQLFGDATGGVPLFYSPPLASFVTIVTVALTCLLLVVGLVLPGGRLLSLWHVLVLCIMLLPVAHSFYLIHALPILWIRAVRLATADKLDRSRSVLLLALWGAWWMIVCRVQWPGDMVLTASSAGYAAMMAATYIALGSSVLDEALRHHASRQQPVI